MENFQLQELRKLVKTNGDEVIKQFRDTHKELKIESDRGRPADTYHMGKQILSRQRLGQTHKVEIIIRNEKEGLIQEEDNFLGDILG